MEVGRGGVARVCGRTSVPWVGADLAGIASPGIRGPGPRVAAEDVRAYNEKTFMLSARRRAGEEVNVAMSSSPKGRGPRPLSEILGNLFAARGYGRLQAAGELESAWASAVGEPGASQTRV